MLVIPKTTEKAYRAQVNNTYIFTLSEDGSKQEVAASVEALYGVKVKDVRILTRKGKKTRFSKGKHAYPGTTFRKDKRIAYVTLVEGNKIPLFEEVKEEETSKSSKKGEK
ncbi:MAG: 50S ribosomal protein L23 [Candidatus Saccharibacteria bacterium]|nr:50S ribosomal protein L23 [Candidatus Saccharibacteria bacterium]